MNATTIEAKVTHTTEVLTKIFQGTNEKFPFNDKYQYAQAKSILENLSKSNKIMRESLAMPFGFPQQFMFP